MTMRFSWDCAKSVIARYAGWPGLLFVFGPLLLHGRPGGLRSSIEGPLERMLSNQTAGLARCVGGPPAIATGDLYQWGATAAIS